MTIHATAVAIDNRAVLLRGPSAAGKSDVALRMLALPPMALAAMGHPTVDVRLIADDRVAIDIVDDRLFASPPAALRGRLELRGLGIMPVLKLCDRALVTLVVDLTNDVPRLPEPATITIYGVAIPRLAFRPFDASTPLKIALALLAATAPSETHQPE